MVVMNRVCRNSSIVLAVILILAAANPDSQAAEKPTPGPLLTINAEAQYEFAERYFEKGDYQPAIGEYQRFIYFFPDDERVFEARYRIGQAHMRRGEYARALEAFHQILDRHDTGEARRKAYLMISRCHLKQQAFGRALKALEALAATSADTDTRDVAHYETGWIYIGLADWKAARSALDRISPANRARYRIDKLADELRSDPEIATKHPRVAGVLALFPGAGYLYTERPHDALIAFGINAGWMLAAYTSFDNDNDALGVLISIVGLGFYTGSIYGSVNSAHKFNRRTRDGFVEKLRQRHRVTLSAHSFKGGGLLALQLRF